MDIELVAQTRMNSGKGAARALRRRELVPAILYGPKMESSVSLCVPKQRLERLLRDMGEESKLLRLTIEGQEAAETKQVLIREVQVQPVRRRFLHVDFYEVPLDQPTVVEVPVETLGEAVGVKKGGVLNLIQRMLSVRCLPGEIPDKVQVDVSPLDIGESVQVEHLRATVPFELVDEGTMAVVNVVAPEGTAKEGAEAEEE